MRVIKYAVLFLILTFCISCQKEIDVDLPVHESKISLNCHLISGKVPEAIVSASIHSLAPADNLKAIPDAEVLLVEDGIIVDTLLHYNDTLEDYWSVYQVGVFRGTHIIQPNKTYKIQVSHDDYETAFGEALCPDNFIEISEIDISGLKIDSVESYLEFVTFEYFRTGQISFKIDGVFKKELHYFLSVGDKGGEIEAFEIISDNAIFAVEESNLSDGEIYPVQNLYVSGSGVNLSTTITLNVNPNMSWNYEKDISDGIEVRIDVQDDDYFQFNRKLIEYEESSFSLFAEMVFIPSNIEGGYGFVSAGLQTKKTSN